MTKAEKSLNSSEITDEDSDLRAEVIQSSRDSGERS